jgi:predicted NACHT family NTPase
LESIIVQHGLLIERAQRIYSFSHLTFQEYFSAKWFQNHDDWRNLVDYIAKKRCRELFFLFVEMIHNKEDADIFLLFCKEKIDKIIAPDEKLQKFLAWIERKSFLVNISYKSAAVRAFYLKSNQCSGFSPGNDLAFAIDVNLKNDCNGGKFPGLNINIQINFPSPPHSELYLDDNLDAILANCLESSPSFFTLPFLGSGVSTDENFEKLLSNLLDQLPEHQIFQDWWYEKGSTWTEQLRNLSLKYRLISRDWQFSEEQKELLMQYYDANKLLVDCLNSCSVVSDEVRKEIEKTLLLPIAGVKRREESES